MVIKNLKNNIKSHILNVLLVVCFLYGCYQLFVDRGIFTLYNLHKEISQQKLENDLLRKRQEYLEKRVSKLEDDNTKEFDYDFLDELLREKLGVIKKTEKVIFVEQE